MSALARAELDAREMEILAAVDEFRLLSGAQLQALFFPTGTVVGTRRRTQATLKLLVDQKYLSRLDRRVGGVRAGSASYCYVLNTRGKRLIGHIDGRVRALREPGLSFVAHHLAVADVWVAIAQAERAGAVEVIERQTEPACWRRTPKAFGSSEWLRPDLFLSLGIGDYEWRWFIEVDLGTESLKRVERACQRYLAYYRSGVEQAEHAVFPKVAWLANTARRREGIESAIGRLPIADRELFVVGSINQALHILKGGES